MERYIMKSESTISWISPPLKRIICSVLLIFLGTSIMKAEPSVEKEADTTVSGAEFELLMVMAGDDLRSFSFAFGEGGTIELGSGYIDRDTGFVPIESTGTENLSSDSDVIGSFSSVVVFE